MLYLLVWPTVRRDFFNQGIEFVSQGWLSFTACPKASWAWWTDGRTGKQILRLCVVQWPHQRLYQCWTLSLPGNPGCVPALFSCQKENVTLDPISTATDLIYSLSPSIKMKNKQGTDTPLPGSLTGPKESTLLFIQLECIISWQPGWEWIHSEFYKKNNYSIA